MVIAAMRYGLDRDSAEEVVQESLLAAVLMLHRRPELSEEVRDPCRWLAGITLNVAKQLRRKELRRQKIARANAEVIGELNHTVTERAWEGSWLLARVSAAVESLLPQRQAAVLRHMLNGKEDQEIADEMNISRATVRWHRSQAVATLRRHFGSVLQ